MNKNIITIIIVLVVLIGGYFLLRNTNQSLPTLPPTPPENTLTQPSKTEKPNLLEEPLNQSQNQEQPSTPIASPQENEQEYVVIYTDNGYLPNTLIIEKGKTVTFKNQSSKPMWTASDLHPSHRVYAGTDLQEHCPDTEGRAFDQCVAGDIYEFTFNKTGTWKYHNHLNAAHTGTIIVK